MRRYFCALAGTVLLLSACGTTPEERGLTGAGIGAAGGTVLGAVTGLTLVEGALIGAAAGGLAGALTKPETLDLGPPLWKRGTRSSGTASQPAVEQRTMVRDVQRDLARLGYYLGPVDGVAGKQTRAAIRQYQADNGLAANGEVSQRLATHVSSQLASNGVRSSAQR